MPACSYVRECVRVVLLYAEGIEIQRQHKVK